MLRPRSAFPMRMTIAVNPRRRPRAYEREDEVLPRAGYAAAAALFLPPAAWQ